jgi:hypothetical protein
MNPPNRTAPATPAAEPRPRNGARAQATAPAAIPSRNNQIAYPAAISTLISSPGKPLMDVPTTRSARKTTIATIA